MLAGNLYLEQQVDVVAKEAELEEARRRLSYLEEQMMVEGCR
jgi:hypothetical protein